MDTSDRGIHRDHPVELAIGIRQRLHPLQHPSPHAYLRPPVEVLVDRVPVPEPLRHVPPRRTSTEPPGGRLNHHTALHRRPTTGQPRWEQRADHSPSLVRDHITRHDTQPRRPNTEQALATRPRSIATSAHFLARATSSTPAKSTTERLRRSSFDKGSGVSGDFAGPHRAGRWGPASAGELPRRGRRAGLRGSAGVRR